MRIVRSLLLLLIVLVAAASPGCGPSYASGQQFAKGTITPRTRWRASGDLAAPERACDGNTATAAVGDPPRDGMSLTIDLGEPCLFNMVVIDHGPRERGYCITLSIEASMDGEQYRTVATAPGNRKVTAVAFLTPTLARYVRLRAVAAGGYPWTIAEVVLQ